MKKLSFLLIAFAAATASAQSPAPQAPTTQAPAPQPSEPKAATQRPLNLNLNLDDASLRQITRGVRDEPVEGATRGAGGALPSLGGDARRIDPAALRSVPYPKDNGGAY